MDDRWFLLVVLVAFCSCGVVEQWGKHAERIACLEHNPPKDCK